MIPLFSSKAQILLILLPIPPRIISFLSDLGKKEISL